MLNHVDCGGMHGGNDRDVAIGAGQADPQVTGLRVRCLFHSSRIAVTHHIRIIIPDRCDTKFLVEISLCQFDTLVETSSRAGSPTARPGTLIYTITFGTDTIET